MLKIQITVLTIICTLFLFIGCVGTKHTKNISYKPQDKPDKISDQEYRQRCQIIVKPTDDARILDDILAPVTNYKRKITVTDEERKRIIGVFAKFERPFIFLIKKPVSDVVHGAIVTEFENAGFQTIKESENSGKEFDHKYYLQTVLKFGNVKFNYSSDDIITSASIVLTYDLLSTSGNSLRHNIIDEFVIINEGWIAGPSSPGNALINVCLRKVLEQLIGEVDLAIASDLSNKLEN